MDSCATSLHPVPGVPCWDDFLLLSVLYPTAVQLSVMIILVGASRLWRDWALSEANFVQRYIGTKHRSPLNLRFWSTMLFLEVAFSLLSVVLWSNRTYVRSASINSAQQVLAICFLITYVLRLMKAECRPLETLSPALLISVYTVVPALVDFNQKYWLTLEFLRVFMALAAIQQLESIGVLSILSDFRRALLFMFLRTLAMVIGLAGVVYSLEMLGDFPGFSDQTQEVGMGGLSFMRVVYFTVVTISTVGYGDYAPSTMPARMFICVEIVIGVIFFSMETSNLLGIKQLLNTGTGAYRAHPSRKHVLVIGGGVRHIGQVFESFVKEILGDFEREDPGWPDIVVLCPHQQDRLLDVIKNQLKPEKRRRIFYFVGSSMVCRDLERVCLEQAAMIYVLADVFARDKDAEDGYNLLRALSVMKVKHEANIRLMVLRPEMKERAVNSGIDPEHCFSVDEMKCTFLAHCCRSPGFLTVVSNLTDSQERANVEVSRHCSWLREYLDATGNVIHGIMVSQKYRGMTWSQFYLKLYNETQSIPIAAQVDGRVLLNPGRVAPERLLHGGEIVFVIGSRFQQNSKWVETFSMHKKRTRDSTPAIPPIQMKTHRMAGATGNLPYITGNNKVAQSATWEERTDILSNVVSDQGGHIILAMVAQGSVQWSHVAGVIGTLRTPSRHWEHRPIIVLAPEGPPEGLVNEFTDVGFVIGSPSNTEDLDNVHADLAFCVVLLAGDADGDVIAELRDHNSVVAASTLDQALSGPNNITFFMYELHVEDSAVFAPSPVREKNSSTVVKSSSDIKMMPQFACGQCFSLSFLGEMLGREYYVPSTMEVLQALVMPARRGQTSFPWLVPVPTDFLGHKFSELYAAWVSSADAAVPLGLYRALPGKESPPLGYVVTNPSPDTVLYCTDRIYVLASTSWGRISSKPNLSLTETGVPIWRKEFHEKCAANEFCRKPSVMRTTTSDVLDKRNQPANPQVNLRLDAMSRHIDGMGKRMSLMEEKLDALLSRIPPSTCHSPDDKSPSRSAAASPDPPARSPPEMQEETFHTLEKAFLSVNPHPFHPFEVSSSRR
eukprot:TRINITY_DN38589_c0_g1_i1.p1 TRINITY_DN38589_c0_g1~~TRINITY_DN38589_c0_g1_i1.p1  ORF type:complete len:1064 (+),score=149.37 TRINITY_DN38589_c0_g1_i1:200-3391(+)